MNALRLSFLLLLLAAQAAVAPQIQAQVGQPSQPDSYSVVCFSFIFPPSGTQIRAYAYTEMAVNVAAYYDAEVDAQLSTPSQSYPPATSGAASPKAEGTIFATSAAAMFTLNSSHYLYPTDYTTDEFERPVWIDPMGFSVVPPQSSQGWFEITGEFSNEESLNFQCYVASEWISLGTTYWFAYGSAPQINGISISGTTAGGSSVSYLTLSSSGTLAISGLYLTAGGNDPSPTMGVAGGGGGLTLGSVQIVSDGGDHTNDSLNVSYSVDNNSGSVGTYGITVTTVSGTSNTYNVVVYDPTPMITGVSPDPKQQHWQAATSPLAITVTGTGFGTNPQLNITGSGVTSFGQGGQSGDLSTISATVYLNQTGGNVAITVTSNGFSGSHMFSSGSNSAGSNEWDGYVDAGPVPAPTIMFGPVAGGTVCANGTLNPPASPVVGQKIVFSGCIPSGTAASSEIWNMPPNFQTNAVAGWRPSAASTDSPTSVTAPVCQTGASCDVPAFYFIAPGSYVFKFSYVRASDNQPSPSASVTMTVTGPTATGTSGAFLTATVQAVPPPYDSPIVNVWPQTIPYLGMGGGGDANDPVVPGIRFYVGASAPSGGPQGQFQFVQLITSSRWKFLSNPPTSDQGAGPGPPNHSPIPSGSSGVLDNWYPYAAAIGYPNQSLDAPGMDLQLTKTVSGTTTALPLGEGAVSFGATMYLMWDPGIPGPEQQAGCSPATNNPAPVANPMASTCTGSIPVPLGSLTWGFNADAINTMLTGTTAVAGTANFTGWVVNCGAPSVTTSSSAAYAVGSYPHWNQVSTNN